MKLLIFIKRSTFETMDIDSKYMNMCLQLAKQGIDKAPPNPMVGCIITHNGEVVAQGHHEEFGKAHAEVNAINNMEDQSILKECILYVNLEPCSHHGKTPPCVDLIIKHNIPKVIIGCIDSYSEVSGKGIKKLKFSKINLLLNLSFIFKKNRKESAQVNARFAILRL